MHRNGELHIWIWAAEQTAKALDSGRFALPHIPARVVDLRALSAQPIQVRIPVRIPSFVRPTPDRFRDGHIVGIVVAVLQIAAESTPVFSKKHGYRLIQAMQASMNSRSSGV